MKSATLALGLVIGLAGAPAFAQISVGIGLPSIQIGINVPEYPQLTVVPGYPVYYAPSVDGNLFFYEGRYWSLNGDRWYSSSWYNGPWNFVAPEAVPMFLWRIPVRYYRRPPPFFRGWRGDEIPHWGEHWGPGWQASHRGWDHWDRRGAPPPAPLPEYQRNFRGDHYPRAEQQEELHRQNYSYGAHPEPNRGGAREQEHEHEHEHDRDR